LRNNISAPIKQVELSETSHLAWKGRVTVHWQNRRNKKEKGRYLEKSMQELTGISRKDWNFRHDLNFGASYMYFRNREDAVSFYFYHS